MKLFRMIFGKKKEWTELETIYTSDRMEYIRAVLAENEIPYKVRAALLPVPINAVSPMGTAGQSLWYLSVHPEDVGKVRCYLRQE